MLKLLLGITTILIIGQFAPRYLQIVQSRRGIVLYDPLLTLFTPLDVSWIIFTIEYSLIVVGILYLVRQPGLLLIGVLSYALITILRMLSVYLTNLEPLPDMLALSDPFLCLVVYDNQPITKDLFFSGHTSTMFLFFLIVRRRVFKILFLIGTVLIGLLLMIQHIHYTIDILAAVPITWLVYRLVLRLNKKYDAVTDVIIHKTP